MDFGKVDPATLEKIDFTLPPDRPETTRVLQTLGGRQKSKVFVGCAKWGRKDWVGKIYPKGTKEADYLAQYAKRLNCIELNTTFYHIPTVSQTRAWRSKVGDDFLFCPKFTDQITHTLRLKNTQELTDRFIDGIRGFENNLGPIFLMPHPGMGPKTIDTIEAFLQSLPDDLDLFTEVRHPGWFEDPAAFHDLFNRLERNQSGAVITDSSGRRDCVHMRLTTPEAFIRFVGNGLHPTDHTRIDDWVQRIKLWMSLGIEKVYFFMHQHEELHSPELCKYLVEQLNLQCGTALRAPEFLDSGELFDLPAHPRAPAKKS